MSQIKVHRIHNRTNSSVKSILDEYTLYPESTLRKVREMFGAADFDSTMQIFLKDHCLKFAFLLSVKYFLKRRK